MFQNFAKGSTLLVLLVGSLAMTGPCPASGENPATISGTITEAGSGDPIEGAMVAVGRLSGGIFTGTTDSAGNYTVSVPVPSGSEEVVVEAAGANHAPARYNFAGEPLCYFRCTPTGGEFTITPGEAVSGIDISLAEGGTISGLVTNAETGEPIESVNIRFSSDEEYSSYSLHFNAHTDSNGEYTQLLALGSGSYHVSAAAPPEDNFVTQAWSNYPCEYNSCPLLDTDPIEIEAGIHETGFDFALEPGARISGTLQPDDIERIVRLYNGAGIYLYPKPFLSTTLPDADWSFNQLSGGSYYIELGPAIAPGIDGGSPYSRILHNGLLCPYGGCERASGVPITIPAGSDLSLSEIELPFGGQIQGAIVDGDTGSTPPIAAGSELDLYDVIDAEGNVVGGGTIREEGDNLILDESSGIPPGDYFVRTYHEFTGAGIGYDQPGSNHDALPGYADAMYPDIPCAGLECDTGEAEMVTVTTGSITNITMEVTTGSNISGTVVDDTNGAPVDNAFVKLVNADNEVYATVITDNDGDFNFGAFPAGSYYLRTSMSTQLTGILARQNPYFDKVYGASGNCSEQLCEPADGDEIILDGTSDAGPFELRVDPGPVISGRIIFELTGLLINNGHVEVYDDSDRLVGTYGVNRTTGRYQTTALPPGDYRLVPVVSPAYSDVTTPSGSPGSGTVRSGDPGTGLVVTMGTEDVQADLEMTDTGIELFFRDGFETP